MRWVGSRCANAIKIINIDQPTKIFRRELEFLFDLNIEATQTCYIGNNQATKIACPMYSLKAAGCCNSTAEKITPVSSYSIVQKNHVNEVKDSITATAREVFLLFGLSFFVCSGLSSILNNFVR